jgi:Spy/CpxP family protein refolding chaperone
MKKALIAFAGGLTLLAGVSLSQAQPGMSLDALHESGGVMARFSEALDLTEQQELDIAAIFEEAHDATEADKVRLAELRDAMRALLEAFDDQQAQIIAEEIGEITGELAYQRAVTRADVRAVLTVEQLETLATLREEHEERRGRRGIRPPAGFPEA